MNSHMECVRVTVPAADEEALALGNMEFVRRMRSLVQWAEPGRPVTQTGAMRRGDTTSWMRHFGLRAPSELGPPSMWDIRGIGQPWDIAIETGMLSLTNTKVRPGPTGTVFESDDAASLCQRLESQGITVTHRPWGTWDAIDPEGNVFGIAQAS